MSAPLWAPWRMEYILGPKSADKGCVFCLAQDAPDDELAKRLVVAQTADTIVMMNRYPFAAGHLLIIPRTHTSDLEALDDAAHASLHRVVRGSVVRLKQAVKCEGLNVGINLGPAAGAGIAEHLHVHVVPRWSGDSNFMPVVADKRVIPQALDETRKHLAGFFADLPGRIA
ncbi:MAG: HIT domain-containing protein [Polyangiaceae bacterium]|nr:HIT domain-containing protein [Polyangiaceae bacterium]